MIPPDMGKKISTKRVSFTLKLNITIKEKIDMPVSIETEQVFGEEMKSTKTTIPFVKNNEFDYQIVLSWIGENAASLTWIVFILMVIFVVTAVSNGANMTDGLDGLGGLNGLIRMDPDGLDGSAWIRMDWTDPDGLDGSGWIRMDRRREGSGCIGWIRMDWMDGFGWIRMD